MTIRDLLEETRDQVCYFREQNEAFRMAELTAANPRRRDFDTAALELADQRKELDRLAEEITEKGRKVYVLIGCLNDRRQAKALEAYYTYGLSVPTCARRAGCTEYEVRSLIRDGLYELERLVMQHAQRRVDVV